SSSAFDRFERKASTALLSIRATTTSPSPRTAMCCRLYTFAHLVEESSSRAPLIIYLYDESICPESQPKACDSYQDKTARMGRERIRHLRRHLRIFAR